MLVCHGDDFNSVAFSAIDNRIGEAPHDGAPVRGTKWCADQRPQFDHTRCTLYFRDEGRAESLNAAIHSILPRREILPLPLHERRRYSLQRAAYILENFCSGNGFRIAAIQFGTAAAHFSKPRLLNIGSLSGIQRLDYGKSKLSPVFRRKTLRTFCQIGH